MPLQIGLSGLVLLLGLLSPWLTSLRTATGLAILLFLASSAPLARRAWLSDRELVAVVPALLFARSLAQGLGLTGGLLVLVVRSAGRRGGAPERAPCAAER